MKPGKECYRIDRRDYTQFKRLDVYLACAFNSENNLLLIYGCNEFQGQYYYVYTLEGFLVTSFKSVLMYRTVAEIKFTDDFILTSSSNHGLIRYNDINFKMRKNNSLLNFAVDYDQNGNIYALHSPNLNQIGIFDFDLEFLQTFDSYIYEYGYPISLCIKEDTMFVLSLLNDDKYWSNSPRFIYRICLSSGTRIGTIKLNNRLLIQPMHLCIDDMYNVFISGCRFTNICIWYNSGKARYYPTEGGNLHDTSSGIAYVSTCNKILVLLSPFIRMYNLSF